MFIQNLEANWGHLVIRKSNTEISVKVFFLLILYFILIIKLDFSDNSIYLDGLDGLDRD